MCGTWRPEARLGSAFRREGEALWHYDSKYMNIKDLVTMQSECTVCACGIL
jgi:hypothetical protein